MIPYSPAPLPSYLISTSFFLSFIGIFGLMVGSFLNVVIYRLPKMMEQNWKLDALFFLHSTSPELLSSKGIEALSSSPDTFNLAIPSSRCGHCGHSIRWYENIPVISWLFLKAQCSSCHTSISLRYPLIECLTAFTSTWIAYRYGWSIQMAACLLFNALLICAFWIDWDTQLLPDGITLPLMWAGLFLSYLGYGLVPFKEAFIGAVSGYLSLWLVYWIFYLLFKKEGMGFGDFKLLAALGAWLGWPTLPMIVLVASLSGLAYALMRALTGFRSPSEHLPSAQEEQPQQGHKWSKPLPFGPFLITGGWLVWMVLPTQFMMMIP